MTDLRICAELAARCEIKTRIELAHAYVVNVKTLNNWLNDAKVNLPPGLISPANLALVFHKVGIPKSLMSDLGK